MRRPPLKILIVAVALVAAALATHSTGDSHPQRRDAAPVSAPRRAIVLANPGPARSVQASKPARPVAATAVVEAFARAYVRYLDGGASVQNLPFATDAVRSLAAQAGPIPPGERAGRLALTGIKGPQAGAPGGAQLTFLARDEQHTYFAQITLADLGGWRVGGLIPPDFDTIFGTVQSAASPSGPAEARGAATAFLNSYLAFTYGHASASQLRDVSAGARRLLAGNPPNVPPAIEALTPRVESLVLERAGEEWTVLADVSDGKQTYWVTAYLAQIGGRWLAVSIEPAG